MTPCTRCNGFGRVACWGSAVHTLRCDRCQGLKVEPPTDLPAHMHGSLQRHPSNGGVA